MNQSTLTSIALVNKTTDRTTKCENYKKSQYVKIHDNAINERQRK